MKNFYKGLAFFLLHVSLAFAQGFEKNYDTGYDEESSDLIKTSDGNLLLLGYIAPSDYSCPFRNDFYIVKTSPDGQILWTRLLDMENLQSNSKQVIEDRNGNYYVMGTSGSYLRLVKLDAHGNVLFSKRYTEAYLASYNSMIETSTGELIIVGDIYSTSTTAPNQLFILEIDPSNGSIVWTKTYGSDKKVTGQKIISLSDDNFLIIGSRKWSEFVSGYSINRSEAFIVKLDNTGDTLWTKTISPLQSGHYYDLFSPQDVIETPTNIVVLVNSGDFCTYCSEMASLILDKNGSVDTIKFSSVGGVTKATTMVPISTSSDKFFVTIDDGNGGSAVYLYKMDTSYTINNTNRIKGYQGSSSYYTYSSKIIKYDANSYYISGSTRAQVKGGVSDLFLIKIDSLGNTQVNKIYGKIIVDNLKTCSSNTLVLSDIVVEADNGIYKLFTKTNSAGGYVFSVDTGTYQISHLPKDYYAINCPVSGHSVSLSSYNTSTYNKNFYDTLTINKPILKIDLYTNRQRFCAENLYYINYSNESPINATSVKVSVEFPPEVIPLSSSKPWSLSNNVYSFNIPSLPAFSSGTITITDSIACDNNIRNMTVCAKAWIAPDTVYSSSVSSQWDKSSITVNGYCQNKDSLIWIIKNVGASMAGISKYRIYENDGLLTSGDFQLISNDSLVVKIKANGSSFRLEADQREGHPGKSLPRLTIEGCGTTNFDWGYVNTVAQDDSRLTFDYTCSQIVSSHDPNEKDVIPSGIGENHYIKEDDRLEYTIHFQNTGNDTALVVVVKDTLSSFLDPKTIEIIGASHNFTWDIIDPRVLVFTFNGINLPDSTTDESKSMGFVKFKISQVKNVQKGTVITNKAAIYFDYNDPVITKPVNTIVYDTVLAVPVKIVTDINNQTGGTNGKIIDVVCYPNPSYGDVNFLIENKVSDLSYDFKLYSVDGKLITQLDNLSDNFFILKKDKLEKGLYLFSIQFKNGQRSTGKLILVK